MSYRKTAQYRFDSVAGVVLLVAFFVGLFFILRGLFWVLTWIAPVMLIAALIIDRSVVINYGKWLIKTVKNNPLMGIAAIVFTAVGYMVVFPYLFAKSILKKKLKDVSRQIDKDREGELVDFEEIESKSKKRGGLQLPELEKRENKTEYDKLFD